MSQTAMQRKAVDSIVAKITQYLDWRYQNVRRMNPKFENVWEDLTWQQLQALRNTLSGDKAFGPVRLHIAEILLGDDFRRVKDMIGIGGPPQLSLLNEVVEQKDEHGKKGHGQLDINDMRSLYGAIDSSLQSLVQVIQAYIWWDLEDACDFARFDKKAGFIQAFEANGITPEMADFYAEQMKATSNKKPNAEDVIVYELKNLKRTLDNYRSRRNVEPGYQMIIRREQSPAENADMLIEAMAGQANWLKTLKRGGSLSEAHIDQFAKAMNTEPGLVSAEKAIAFLEGTYDANRKRLKAALSGGGTGQPFNAKRAQLEEYEKKFAELLKDRKLEETQASN